MEKILFISNITKKIGSFSIASIEAAHACDLQFHIAANWDAASTEQIDADQEEFNIKIHNIQLRRSPYSFANIRAYKQLVEIIKSEGIDYIHCNTPVGGILGRFAGKKCKVKKVIYQVHGFHFYKEAPLKNWLLYYPVERWLAHYTDVLITINQEDYARAQRFHLRNHGKVYCVPGVGMDLSQYRISNNIRVEKRNELNLTETDVVLISMGDLIDRKNYPIAIEAIAKASNTNLHYYICGKGPDEKKLKQYANTLGVGEQIHFLGFRTDIKELLRAADIFLFTSKQEGLPRSLMEAMASGLPCVASNIRGNNDLLEGTKGGYLCETVVEYADAINQIAGDKQVQLQMQKANIERMKQFDMQVVVESLKSVYLQEFSFIE